MARTVHRGILQCPCQDCRESPKSATAEQHRTINRVVTSFDEKERRLFVAYLAGQSGRGAIEHLGARLGISIQVTSMDDQSVQVASIQPQCLFAPIPAA